MQNEHTGDQIDVLICDRDNHVIRMISILNIRTKPTVTNMQLLAGKVRVAGFSNGTFENARFNEPFGVAVMKNSQIVFVSDHMNDCIRILNLKEKKVFTISSLHSNQAGANFVFKGPIGIAIHKHQERMYVSEFRNHTISELDISALHSDPLSTALDIKRTYGVQSKGGFNDGVGDNASFCSPQGMTFSTTNADILFVCETGNRTIRNKLIFSPSAHHMSNKKEKKIHSCTHKAKPFDLKIKCILKIKYGN